MGRGGGRHDKDARRRWFMFEKGRFAGVREKRMTSRNGVGERDGHGKIDLSIY